MLRKISFLFIFAFILPLYFLTPFFFSNKLQAAVSCQNGLTGINFSYDFTPPLTDDKTSITVTINHGGNLPDGKYSVGVSNGQNYLVNYHDPLDVVNGSDLVFANVSPQGGKFYSGNNILVALKEDQGNVLCSDQFNVISPEESSNPAGSTCSIKFNTDFKPNSGIFFYVTGLSGDDVDKRGMVLTRTDDKGRPLVNDLSNICDTNKRLRDPGGVGFPNSNQNRWPASYYTVKVTEGCEGFPLNTAKGNNICHSPILIKVDPNDGRVIGPVFDLECVRDKQCQNLPNGGDLLCLPNPETGLLGCRLPEKGEGHNPCTPDSEGNAPFKCQTAIGEISTSPGGFIKSVLVLILSLSGGIIILLIIVNGYKLMISQGDPEKVKEARESVMSAIAGLLLIIFSIVILQFITVDVLHLPGFE